MREIQCFSFIEHVTIVKMSKSAVHDDSQEGLYIYHSSGMDVQRR